MFLVICYAVHNKEVASIDPFYTYNDALKFLKEDADNTYREEDGDTVLDMHGDSAELKSCDGDLVWTWSIHKLPAVK